VASLACPEFRQRAWNSAHARADRPELGRGAPAHGIDGTREVYGPTTRCEREELTYGGPPEK
jgi:hypothetical protein